MKLYILLFPSTWPEARFIKSPFVERVCFMKDWLCFIHTYILSALRSAWYTVSAQPSVGLQWTRHQVNHRLPMFSKTSFETLVFLHLRTFWSEQCFVCGTGRCGAVTVLDTLAWETQVAHGSPQLSTTNNPYTPPDAFGGQFYLQLWPSDGRYRWERESLNAKSLKNTLGPLHKAFKSY